MKIFLAFLNVLPILNLMLFGCSNTSSVVEKTQQTTPSDQVSSQPSNSLSPSLAEASSSDKGLSEAANKCDYELASMLLSKGANPNVPVTQKQESTAFSDKSTSLLTALGRTLYLKLDRGSEGYKAGSYESCNKVLRLLMTQKLDLNLVLPDGTGDSSLKGGSQFSHNYANKSPLHSLALSPVAPDLIKFFLEKGANPNIRTVDIADKGSTPLMLMVENSALDDVFNPEPMLHPSKKNEFDKNAKESFYLLAKAGDINTQDDNGMTALMRATSVIYDKAGYYHTVNELLKLGAKVEIKNKEGKTAIDIATENGNTKMIKLLTKGNQTPASSVPSSSP
jgi:Ankyrin repeats (3 copies)/Ankyrin repeat